MKSAAGEANLTVVAIILIAVVVAIATPLVTSLMTTASYRSCCNDAGGMWEKGKCKVPKATCNSDTKLELWTNFQQCSEKTLGKGKEKANLKFNNNC